MKINEFNPGLLNRRVDIKKPYQTPDGSGGYEDGLALVKTVWANIEAISGQYLWLAQQNQGRVTHKITIRYTKDIDRSCILVFDNRIFEIEYIINLNEQNRFLEIQVYEKQ